MRVLLAVDPKIQSLSRANNRQYLFHSYLEFYRQGKFVPA
jgi:hypothetical protein